MDTPIGVRTDLLKLLPSSLHQEVSCFCFYDDHPEDPKKIDVTVCTKRGEVLAVFKRDIIFSILLETSKIKDIFIHRNYRCELFYIVDAGNKLIVLAAKETLNIHLTITNVHRYDFVDNNFSGLPCLRVIRRDDAIPLFYDSNFTLKDNFTSKQSQPESAPVITQLFRKLTEAKYNLKKHENTLQEYVQLKQAAAFCHYEKSNPNSAESIFKLGTSTISKLLNIKTRTPFVKLCNQKIILIVNVSNGNEESIEDIQLLFHGILNRGVTYTTKIYEEISIAPYWQEKDCHVIKSLESSFIVGVIQMTDLKYSVTSKIEFDPVLSYTKNATRYVMPLENIFLTALETMGENFDIILSNEDEKLKLLAIIATSEKTEMIFRNIDHIDNPIVNIREVLCKYLNMEKSNSMAKVIIHKKFSNHILYGLMVVFHEDISVDSWKVYLYSRSKDQVLAFIHYMYDAVPYRIMATLPDHYVTAKDNDLPDNNLEADDINFTDYATSLLNQSKFLLEYFDKCIIKMNENPLPDVKDKIGKKIYILSVGMSEFLALKNKVLLESKKGVKSIRKEEDVIVCSEEIME